MIYVVYDGKGIKLITVLVVIINTKRTLIVYTALVHKKKPVN